MPSTVYTREVSIPVNRFTSIRTEYDQNTRRNDSLRIELTKAMNAVGDALLPEDAVVGEIFHFWVGNQLLQVTKQMDTRCNVIWRANGREYKGPPKEG